MSEQKHPPFASQNNKSADESEAKILFMDGDKERVLRGIISGEDETFVTLTRRDGTVRIAKSQIIKIENRKSVGDNSVGHK